MSNILQKFVFYIFSNTHSARFVIWTYFRFVIALETYERSKSKNGCSLIGKILKWKFFLPRGNTYYHSSWSCTSVFAHRMSTIRCALFREMSKNRCAAFQRCAEFEWGVREAKPPGKFFSNFAQNIAILVFFFKIQRWATQKNRWAKMDETKKTDE